MRTHRAVLLATSFALAALAASGQIPGKPVHTHRVAQESPADIALRNAEAAIDKKDYDTAEKSLRDAIAQDGNVSPWFDLGFVLNAKGQNSESIGAYRKAVAVNPLLFESNLNLGLMLARNGDPEAEKFLRAATQLKPSSPHPADETVRAWLALGQCLEKSSPQRAVEAFKAAAILQPRNAAPHLAAAADLEAMKQYDAAETEYKHAAELDPKSAEALAGLVNIYQKNGRLPEAQAALRKFVAVVPQSDPQSALAQAQLGRVLAAMGKNDEAITALQTSLQLSPGNPAIVRQLAELLSDNKKYAEAEALLRPLSSNSPTMRPFITRWAVC